MLTCPLERYKIADHIDNIDAALNLLYRAVTYTQSVKFPGNSKLRTKNRKIERNVFEKRTNKIPIFAI